MHNDAQRIIQDALREAMPGAAVRQALEKIEFNPEGKLIVVSTGKAGWEMARAATEALGDRIHSGVVVTKYDHCKGELKPLELYEAGHPVPDENSYKATARALEVVSGLTEKDSVLFLLSGGGSALFEQPRIPYDEMADITRQLLACGANIVEMNTIRKRLSAVKGGRFALSCMPAHVYTVVLSDIIGDPLDMIASGPAYPDASTCEQALQIVKNYGLKLSEQAMALISSETPKELTNVTTYITGSVKQLCRTAAETCRELGYEPIFLTASLSCEAREAGAFLASIARDHQDTTKSLAFLCGGETVVHLTGKGLGGRNQEIALGAAEGLVSCKDTCVFSVGSDGSDGPTDAAGGIADENTLVKLQAAGLDIRKVMADNDAYHALKAIDGLIMTGPTGTNVNDLTVALVKR